MQSIPPSPRLIHHVCQVGRDTTRHKTIFSSPAHPKDSVCNKKNHPLPLLFRSSLYPNTPFPFPLSLPLPFLLPFLHGPSNTEAGRRADKARSDRGAA